MSRISLTSTSTSISQFPALRAWGVQGVQGDREDRGVSEDRVSGVQDQLPSLAAAAAAVAEGDAEVRQLKHVAPKAITTTVPSQRVRSDGRDRSSLSLDMSDSPIHPPVKR